MHLAVLFEARGEGKCLSKICMKLKRIFQMKIMIIETENASVIIVMHRVAMKQVYAVKMKTPMRAN